MRFLIPNTITLKSENTMPRSIELLHTQRAAQFKQLAQIRNTLPRTDSATVIDLYSACTIDGGLVIANLQDWQLELISVLAGRYLHEVAP